MKTWKRGSEEKDRRNRAMLRMRQGAEHPSYRVIGERFGISGARARFIIRREKRRQEV